MRRIMAGRLRSWPGAKTRLIILSPEGTEEMAEATLERIPDWADVVDHLVLDTEDHEALLGQIRTIRPELLLVTGPPEHLPLDVLLAAKDAGTVVWFLVGVGPNFAPLGRVKGFAGLPWERANSLTLKPYQAAIKRGLDLGLSLLALLPALLLGILVAAAVRISSPGPILYRQERVGKDGRSFTILKFRTMKEDAESGGPKMSVPGDSRLTPIGGKLKDWQLDELPQLWNIIRGDMSLIGPRPERPVFVEEFSSANSAYAFRHRIPVGLTGLAQLTGDYATRPDDKLRSDLLYAANWSLWLDLRLLLRTAGLVFERIIGTKGGNLAPLPEPKARSRNPFPGMRPASELAATAEAEAHREVL